MTLKVCLTSPLPRPLSPSLLSNPFNTSCSIILIMSLSLSNPVRTLSSHIKEDTLRPLQGASHHGAFFPAQIQTNTPPNFPDVHSPQYAHQADFPSPATLLWAPVIEVAKPPPHSWYLIKQTTVVDAVLFLCLHYLKSYTTIHCEVSITISGLQMRKLRLRELPTITHLVSEPGFEPKTGWLKSLWS